MSVVWWFQPFELQCIWNNVDQDPWRCTCTMPAGHRLHWLPQINAPVVVPAIPLNLFRDVRNTIRFYWNINRFPFCMHYTTYIPQPIERNHHTANHTLRKINGIDSVRLGPANQDLHYLFCCGTGHLIVSQLKFSRTSVLILLCEMPKTPQMIWDVQQNTTAKVTYILHVLEITSWRKIPHGNRFLMFELPHFSIHSH